ncbi:MAG: hypothetical protein RLY70_2669 [Planctomycetota bacterium]|jgi:Domain of Unknown Function (DUF1080)
MRWLSSAWRAGWIVGTVVALAAVTGQATLLAKGPVVIDPAKADADFAIQGEYAGEVESSDGKKAFGVQIIALGMGKFQAVGYPGGLPGAGWNGEPKIETKGEMKDGAAVFATDAGSATVKDGALTIADKNGNMVAKFARVERKSQTLGAAPPAGATVLFDGKNADAWQNGRVEDGLLVQGTTTKAKFGSHKLHIEFRLPYQPEDRGQGRGNSGIYLQGRYECQMLDSFGLTGEQNECGGIYSVKKPDVNMCLPPLSWQTYDIDYTAAKYDAAGKLVANPRVTIQHNGVVIHKDVELPGERVTTAAPAKVGPEPGPIYLQDHGNPVRYRNIWIVETK